MGEGGNLGTDVPQAGLGWTLIALGTFRVWAGGTISHYYSSDEDVDCGQESLVVSAWSRQ